MQGIDDRIVAIEQDREHGASFLTMAAVSVLADAASTDPTGDRWEPYVARVARRLAAAKPAMAGLRNASQCLLRRLSALGPAEGRQKAQKLSEDLRAKLRASAQCAAANAARLIAPNGAIATCSYSSAVLRACQKAHEAGAPLRVLVFEPVTGGDAPGRHLAGDLTDAGISARVVGGPAASEAIVGVQAVLIGADAAVPECVVNGTPSLSLARAARGRVPLYVVCETAKFAREAQVDIGYDRVPLGLVTGVVTEVGILRPADVARRVEKGDGSQVLYPRRPC